MSLYKSVLFLKQLVELGSSPLHFMEGGEAALDSGGAGAEHHDPI